jgi:hypothetical protein
MRGLGSARCVSREGEGLFTTPHGLKEKREYHETPEPEREDDPVNVRVRYKPPDAQAGKKDRCWVP